MRILKHVLSATIDAFVHRNPRLVRVASLLVLIALGTSVPGRSQSLEPLRRPALGPYIVIALRVEFQPDTTRFTTGDGIFAGELYEGLTPKIDPLPHDSAYFAAHLTFLEQYVAHVSDGKTSVETHLLPDVVRVSQPMGAYAPTGPNSDDPVQRARLARLVEEAWTLADQQVNFSTAGLDPERTAFLIFHAGVGRDVELTGTTLDRTPEDLPSLFFGPSTLEALLPDANITFKGMRVDHSLILPRTETRRGVDFVTDEPFLIEISINGMLAASFFNFLGVPDLFDTESGQSAIGPFGLMDPLGIFAYGGLFAPEPSGWTRYFLGWADPIEIRGAAERSIELQASSIRGVSDLARVWISESEYFLVENRHRDPSGDGVNVSVAHEGGLSVYNFDNGIPGFTSQDVSAFPGGVVIAVDDYDWALPGGLDEDEIERNGGILIWHVDERVIREALADNAVNANPNHRGVDLEEADSGQDLGFPSENPFAPAADLGSPFDFWFEGNPVRVVNQFGQEIALYQNRFGPDTYPNSDAASGGPSFIEIGDFTAPDVTMSFTFRRIAGQEIAPLELPYADALQAAVEEAGTPTSAPVWRMPSHTIVDVGLADGSWLINIVLPDESLQTFSALTPTVRVGDDPAWVERSDAGLQFVRYELEARSIERTSIPGSAGATVAGVAVSYGEQVAVLTDLAGTAALFALTPSGVTREDLPGIGSPIFLGLRDTGGGAYFLAYGRSGAVVPGGDGTWSYSLSPEERVGRPVSGVDASGFMAVLPLPDRGTMLVLQPGGDVDEIRALAATLGELALAEVTGDRQLDILAPGDSVLYAYTRSGAVADGFPIRLSAPAVEAVAVGEGAEGPAIFVPLATGVIDAFERNGWSVFRRKDGYPLTVGAEPISLTLTRPVMASPSEVRLHAISSSGQLHGWQEGSLEGVLWGGPFRDAFRSSLAIVDVSDEPAPPARLLVTRETYNWPNPIREGRTYLRCTTSEDASIRITIIDGAGSLVEELSMESVRAGVPTEMLWETNASSGLYFARVTATSVTGREETHVIKMAVIR